LIDLARALGMLVVGEGVVYFGQTERAFRPVPNTHFGGRRTVISMPNSRADLAASMEAIRMVDWS
jgi:hypothetical protein